MQHRASLPTAVNVHELKNFLTLAETLHFGRASQACNLSPSALTRSIQRLEDTVGEPLFLRNNRTVTLTAAGEKFRNYASAAVRDWETFCAELKDDGSVGGLVSIYASVTAVYSLLPELLESYRNAYPEVNLELRTGSAEEAVQQVLSGEIDVAVAALPDRRHASLEFLPLAETGLIFVAPKNHGHIPTSGDDQFDLNRAPLVLPRSGLSRRRIDQWLRKRPNNRPNPTTEVSGNEGILAMVRLGCGIGIVPELVLERSPFRDDLQRIENAPKLAPYVVGLCTTRNNLRRPGIAALWELAQR
ncbi:HTH-type transcriptional activator IlvY [Sulfuriroseicoccus oceanibius]|uniref:HTH-type transcriptional activator IlvY n=1 Tax=Sulfuriroseicoccus oceanibius TaxID=2707525 RepID=A0A7T7JCR9_9BACT|nr:HTH-type transcriptional activator IlvY [Sulfuriroseicoccus oceanibius]QQL45550.1 HTH-type transcriptional activator IlvY [Sulfuriroseicoccus oceanibius]